MTSPALRQAISLFAFALLLGFLRTFAPNSIPWAGGWPSKNATAEEAYDAVADENDPAFISLSELLLLKDDPSLLILDARKNEDYLQGHIPGSKSLPFYALEEFAGAALEGTTAETPVVVYCEGVGCELSLFLGRELKNSGFQDVKVFYGGWPEWTDAALPVEKAEAEDE